ncbi:potassium-transporting ATPase subunit KdpA [Paracoccus ravus]|uniref:potassium-transporting ATPase subunit KdpA n=1 Tax=Paracoccus ravus TaxID=2447760 RepID=UPI002468AD0F|nr:potassium-transporting ATPase subunit KdpA [Paracoccus ravus]
MQEAGPHGLTETLYAYSSAVGNTGSAYAGWGAAGQWQTTAIGLPMILGRYAIIVPMLAIAGALVAKQPSPATAGTFPTHRPLFVTLLILTVVILGALTFVPVLALGPIAEQTAVLAN